MPTLAGEFVASAVLLYKVVWTLNTEQWQDWTSIAIFSASVCLNIIRVQYTWDVVNCYGCRKLLLDFRFSAFTTTNNDAIFLFGKNPL